MAPDTVRAGTWVQTGRLRSGLRAKTGRRPGKAFDTGQDFSGPTHSKDLGALLKGRRKELIRAELHGILKEAFGVPSIHSEYGMTELLSQAYSKGNGIFETPPWMKIMIRDTEDPLSLQAEGKTGGINIIDLANLYSCSFIATQDLGKTFPDGSFEVLGRFDNSDIRGCNLMII